MHKDGYWTEFRLKNQLTEVEREFFEVMTRRRQSHRALPDRLKKERSNASDRVDSRLVATHRRQVFQN